MKPFSQEKDALVEAARQEAIDTEPVQIAQAGGGDGDAPDQKRSPMVKPSKSVKTKFKRLRGGVKIHPPGKKKDADNVIAIFMNTRSGQALVNDLDAVLYGPDGPKSKIEIDFRRKKRIPGEEENPTPPAGKFLPHRRDAKRYTVYVGWETGGASSGSINIGSHVSGIFTTISHPLFFMAETLFHELLHVWFIHTFRDPIRYRDDSMPRTGHSGSSPDGRGYESIHPEFEKRLRRMLDELEEIEKALRKK